MADRMSLRLEGVDELQRKLGTLVTARVLRESLRSAGETIKTEASQYPPETAANRPPYPYYQRGLGTWTSRARVRKVSENLSKQWRVKVSGAKSVTISNKASYAEFVHGVKQALFHRQRGWKRLKPTAKRLMPKIRLALVKQWRRIISLN